MDEYVLMEILNSASYCLDMLPGANVRSRYPAVTFTVSEQYTGTSRPPQPTVT